MKYVVWSLFLLLSCEPFSQFGSIEINELDFGSQPSPVEIFVTGGITSQLAYHQIVIEQPGDVLSGREPEFIKNATVRIIGSIDTIEYVLIDTTYRPYFRTKNLEKAKPGVKYELQIEYSGKLYTASDSLKVVEPFEYENIELPRLDENDNSQLEDIRFNLKKHDFGYPIANMWVWIPHNVYDGNFTKEDSPVIFDTGKTYSHWVSDPNAIFSFNTYFNGIGPLNKLDTISTFKYSLSNGYYKYLIALFSETDWKQGEFATQPGNLHTNFSTGAAGFFFVSDCYVNTITGQELLDLVQLAK